MLGIGFFTLCFLMTSLGGQFSAKRLADSPFTIRTEGKHSSLPRLPRGMLHDPPISRADEQWGCGEDDAQMPPLPRLPPDPFQGR